MRKRRRHILCAIALSLGAAFTAPSLAKEPALTIRKSPFSSSRYRLWAEPRRGATPRVVERVIRRHPRTGAQARKLEERGGHFTSDRKAPYVEPSQR